MKNQIKSDQVDYWWASLLLCHLSICKVHLNETIKDIYDKHRMSN
jgi:hypothetical protein